MSRRVLAVLAFCCLLNLAGCSLVSDTKSDADKRDEVAKATERAKPELQKAGRELKEAAKTAAELMPRRRASRKAGSVAAIARST